MWTILKHSGMIPLSKESLASFVIGSISSVIKCLTCTANMLFEAFTLELLRSFIAFSTRYLVITVNCRHTIFFTSYFTWIVNLNDGKPLGGTLIPGVCS